MNFDLSYRVIAEPKAIAVSNLNNSPCMDGPDSPDKPGKTPSRPSTPATPSTPSGPSKAPSRRRERQNDEGVAVAEAEPKLKEPKHYAVLLHNDDYTTMEFVTEVLQRFFHKNGEEAVQIMLKVHELGKGVAGIYTYQIAETKVAQVEAHARDQGFPLKTTTEEL